MLERFPSRELIEQTKEKERMPEWNAVVMPTFDGGIENISEIMEQAEQNGIVNYRFYLDLSSVFKPEVLKKMGFLFSKLYPEIPIKSPKIKPGTWRDWFTKERGEQSLEGFIETCFNGEAKNKAKKIQEFLQSRYPKAWSQKLSEILGYHTTFIHPPSNMKDHVKNWKEEQITAELLFFQKCCRLLFGAADYRVQYGRTAGGGGFFDEKDDKKAVNLEQAAQKVNPEFAWRVWQASSDDWKKKEQVAPSNLVSSALKALKTEPEKKWWSKETTALPVEVLFHTQFYNPRYVSDFYQNLNKEDNKIKINLEQYIEVLAKRIKALESRLDGVITPIKNRLSEEKDAQKQEELQARLQELRQQCGLNQLRVLLEEARGRYEEEHLREKEKEKPELNFAVKFQKDYLDKNDAYFKDTLKAVDAQLPAPMHPDCRMSIVIPAYKEGSIIYNTLKQYTVNQLDKKTGKNLGPNLWEIIVLVNTKDKSIPIDQATIDEIKRFQKDYPQFKVYTVSYQFDFPDKPRMGSVFKLVTDLAVMRNLKRNTSLHRQAEHTISALGADAKGVNPYYLASALEVLEDPHVVRYKSESRLPKEALDKWPLLHFCYTLSQLVYRLKKHGDTGAGFGLGSFRSSLYAEAGGYDPTLLMQEEMNLASRMQAKINQDPLKKGKKTLVTNRIDDPRRLLYALWNKVPIAMRYKNFGDPEHEKAMRQFDWKQKLKQPAPDHIECITKEEIQKLSKKLGANEIDLLKKKIELTKTNLEREIGEMFKVYLRRELSLLKTGTDKSNETILHQQSQGEIFEKTKRLFKKALTFMGLRWGNYYTVENPWSIPKKQRNKHLKYFEDYIINWDGKDTNTVQVEIKNPGRLVELFSRRKYSEDKW